MTEKEIAEKMIRDGKEALASALAMIASAEAELAEIDKPKLRHGDYGYSQKEKPCIMIADWDDDVLFCGNRSMGKKGQITSRCSVILGNIFDDLKAMAEPLEEFDIRCTANKRDIISAHFDGEHIQMSNNYDYLEIGQAEEFHQKLGRLIATAKKSK